MSVKRVCIRLAAFLQRYWREIGYYGCVMLALGVIAWGAENYRTHRVKPEDIPLPVSAESLAAQEEARFALPESMQVCMDFSAQPVWNEYHGCWQAHPAVDFACGDGNVYAIGAGVVKTVGESGVLGGFVEIEDGEMLIRYCSVETHEDIQVGDALKMGGLIGRADNSMPGEAHLGAHVHVEAVCAGEMKNILELAETSD